MPTASGVPGSSDGRQDKTEPSHTSHATRDGADDQVDPAEGGVGEDPVGPRPSRAAARSQTITTWHAQQHRPRARRAEPALGGEVRALLGLVGERPGHAHHLQQPAWRGTRAPAARAARSPRVRSSACVDYRVLSIDCQSNLIDSSFVLSDAIVRNPSYVTAWTSRRSSTWSSSTAPTRSSSAPFYADVLGWKRRGRRRRALVHPRAARRRHHPRQPRRAHDARLPADRRLGRADLARRRPPPAVPPRPRHPRHGRDRGSRARRRCPQARPPAVDRRRLPGLPRPRRPPVLPDPRRDDAYAGDMAEEVPTLFEWAGGEDAFRRLIDAFYDRVERDDLLSPLFPGGVGADRRATSRLGGSRSSVAQPPTPTGSVATRGCSPTTAGCRSRGSSGSGSPR